MYILYEHFVSIQLELQSLCVACIVLYNSRVYCKLIQCSTELACLHISDEPLNQAYNKFSRVVNLTLKVDSNKFRLTCHSYGQHWTCSDLNQGYCTVYYSLNVTVKYMHMYMKLTVIETNDLYSASFKPLLYFCSWMSPTPVNCV